MFRRTWFIIVALILLIALSLSGSAQADGTPTPAPDHMHMEGTPEPDHMQMDGTLESDHMSMDGTMDSAEHDMNMADMDHDHAARIDANGAAVKIVAPKDGEIFDRDNVIVRVETTNWPLGETGHHFHLYVNGAEQGMSQGNSPALQARDLQPGENMIEVVLSNELHQELNATDQIIIHYNTSNPTDTAADSASTGLSAGVILTLGLVVAAVLAILGIGFALTRRKRDA